MSDKLAPEVAESEFSRFAESWELDDDVTSMEEEDRESFNTLKRRLTRAIRNGRLRVEDDSTLKFTLIDPKIPEIPEITFKIPTGSAVLAWDKYKERQAIHKLNAFMGEMSGQSPTLFAGMDGRDLKIAQAIAQLFLGS